MSVRPRAATLANGLRVLLHPMPRTGLVSVWCWSRVGSNDERPGVPGISHWAEHMNYKGTRRYGRDEITRRVELAGATEAAGLHQVRAVAVASVSRDDDFLQRRRGGCGILRLCGDGDRRYECSQ